MDINQEKNNMVYSDKNIIINQEARTEPIIQKEYFIELVIDAKTLKNILNVYKPITQEIKLIFHNNEIFISHVDAAHICIINISIPLSSITEYKTCLHDLNQIEICFELETLLNVFKTMNKNDILKFKYSSNNDKIVNITIGAFNYTLNLIDGINIVTPKIPVLPYNSCVNIDIKTFNMFLDQANKISDYIQIKITPTDLTLNANNDNNNNVNIVLLKDQLTYFRTSEIYKSCFACEYLIKIFKTIKNIYTHVNIELNNDYPLKITGEINNKSICEIMILLAPRIEN